VFGANANRLVSAGTDGNITVWDLSGEKTAIKLKGHLKPVTCLAATADGRTVASGGRDGTVRLWDLASAWQKKHAPPAMSHGRWMLAVAFSPDGKLLGVAGGQPARVGEVQIWDVEKRKLVAVGDEPAAQRAAFVRRPGKLERQRFIFVEAGSDQFGRADRL
jgi:WD40 repeat protein